jgi:hypothetical protein
MKKQQMVCMNGNTTVNPPTLYSWHALIKTQGKQGGLVEVNMNFPRLHILVVMAGHTDRSSVLGSFNMPHLKNTECLWSLHGKTFPAEVPQVYLNLTDTFQQSRLLSTDSSFFGSGGNLLNLLNKV